MADDKHSPRQSGAGMGRPHPQSNAPPAPPHAQQAPAKPSAPLLSDADCKRLTELRGMSRGQMPERTPEQEAEFRDLERREREEMWAAQDVRVAELSAKQLTADEAAELQDLRQTIDNQRRAEVRRGDPRP